MQEKNKLVRLIVSMITSLMLVTLGVLYIISCIEIWKTGNSPFTRDSIGNQLIKLAIPSAITVLTLVAGYILYEVFPVEKKKKKPANHRDMQLILKETISPTECRASRAEAIIKERNMRFLFKTGGAMLILLSLIYPTVYLLTPDNFGVVDINTDVLIAALHIILSLIPLVVYCLVSSHLINLSYAREVELLRDAVREHSSVAEGEFYCEENAKVKPISKIFDAVISFFNKNRKIILIAVRCTSVVVGVVFVILGIYNGGMQDVLDKAVNICRECIGLG